MGSGVKKLTLTNFPREMKENKFPLRLDRGEGQGEASRSKTFDANFTDLRPLLQFFRGLFPGAFESRVISGGIASLNPRLPSGNTSGCQNKATVHEVKGKLPERRLCTCI
jgi:hypothetical protein